MTMIPDPIGNPADPNGGDKADPTAGGAPAVGAGDHEADIARSRGEGVPADAPSDSDGVPVGAADADADADRSGGERQAP